MKPERPRSSVMFYTFAAWTVGATALSLLTSGAGARGHAKFDHEKRSAAERCEAAPHGDPWCKSDARESPGPPVFALYKETKDSLDRVHDPFVTPNESALLARAIERAGLIEKAGTPISSLAAAKLVDEAGDRLDRNPSLFADDDVGRALATTTLESARHPFASERAHVLASLTRVPGDGRVPNTRIAQAATGVFMQRVEDTLDRMEKATLAGNVDTCMRTVEEAGPLVRIFVSGPAACVNADRVVRAGHRLASLRIRASVAAANRPPGWSPYRKM